MLVRIPDEIDPDLEMAEVQRRVFAAEGPAVLFERVKGSPFPAVGNLFGTLDRCRFLFRGTLDRVKRMIRLKADPSSLRRSPREFLSAPLTALTALPRRVRGGPALARETALDRLPALRSWPKDGGPFITLPQVFTEHPDRPGMLASNLGMYRVQLGGGRYRPNREAGLHYQIHRGIGVHHGAALARGKRLRVSVFVGGPPAHTFAAMMPLPEGLTELTFAGMLAGRRFRYARRDGFVVSVDADFCITGTVDPARTLPEGPFGDHLGYYSLVHDFPVLEVEKVTHRPDAIWPFTVVGRPPQEDTTFGRMVHELVGPLVPRAIPGVHALHAVDESGVHPLLLALGSERYVPYERRAPRELLTLANAILGFGQCSLAKYLLIGAAEDDPTLDVDDVERFFVHLLERIDWRRDLHFQTETTIDTLDYSGTGLNAGSKVVMAAAGERRRELARAIPAGFALPSGFEGARLALPGVVVISGPRFTGADSGAADIQTLLGFLAGREAPAGLPLFVVVDDAEFCARTLRNFVWVTFTRSNPSHDLHGVGSFVAHKHWGCTGPLVIDARIKPHHAPPVIEDPEVARRVESLAAPGRPLHGVL